MRGVPPSRRLRIADLWLSGVLGAAVLAWLALAPTARPAAHSTTAPVVPAGVPSPAAGGSAAPVFAATPSAPRSLSRTAFASQLGFSLELPGTWRRSALQSRLATEVFTNRSPESEREVLALGGGRLGPAQALTIHVTARPNPGGLGESAFARQDRAVEEQVLYVADEAHGRMWAIGYYVTTPGGDIPFEAERELRQIVASFRVLAP